MFPISDRSRARARLTPGVLALAILCVGGCATLQQIAALRNVDFSLDGVTDPRLAGIDLARVDSWDDLSFADAARLTLAVTRKSMPMDFLVHVGAENPADNQTTARLIRMDWMLLIQDRETLTGVFEDEVLLPPGQPRDIPIRVSLDLVDFFEGSARDLLELALSVAGAGGVPADVALRATPTIDTPLGPMRYPEPITIVSGEVGR
ncbi:MAG TPA: hypothetical protein VGA70_01635 [Longimicrobiales bacterium]